MTDISNSFLRPALPAVLALLALPASAADLTLGGMRLGPVPPARAGTHLGAPIQVGSRVLHPAWTAGTHPALLDGTGDPTSEVPWLAARKELCILLSDDLARASTRLSDFVQAREAEGYTVVVATEADWDVPTSGDDSRAGRIRAWLQARYLDDPGAFLLLVGDPTPGGDGVPMQVTHPIADYVHYYPEWLAELMDPVPTDAWYADLSGDWDADGDGRYGEYPDDAAGVDFGPELFVGRLPVYDGRAEDLDLLLDRLLAHDQDPDKSWRRGVLLPGAFFGLAGSTDPLGEPYASHDDGASILDAIWRALPDGFEATRLYEDAGILQSPYPHDGALSEDAVVEAWRGGQGLVVWAGHGSEEGAYRLYWSSDTDSDGIADDMEVAAPPFMETTRVDDLADAPGAFTFHVSCDNGVPENEANLGAELLYGGAIATATASRVALGSGSGEFGEPYEPRPDLATSDTVAWYYALALTGGHTAGEALSWTRYALPADGWDADAWGWDWGGYGWFTKVEYNLYGDPTRSLEMCATASDCDDGSPCNGAESCQDGFCVHDTPVDCTSLDTDCTVGTCDDATGACEATPRLDGTTCDDGAWCTEVDACEAGTCTGQDRDCGARDGYTAVCDEAAMECSFVAEDPEGEEGGGGCSSSGAPRGLALSALLAFLGLGLRRGRREGAAGCGQATACATRRRC